MNGLIFNKRNLTPATQVERWVKRPSMHLRSGANRNALLESFDGNTKLYLCQRDEDQILHQTFDFETFELLDLDMSRYACYDLQATKNFAVARFENKAWMESQYQMGIFKVVAGQIEGEIFAHNIPCTRIIGVHQNEGEQSLNFIAWRKNNQKTEVYNCLNDTVTEIDVALHGNVYKAFANKSDNDYLCFFVKTGNMDSFAHMIAVTKTGEVEDDVPVNPNELLPVVNYCEQYVGEHVDIISKVW